MRKGPIVTDVPISPAHLTDEIGLQSIPTPNRALVSSRDSPLSAPDQRQTGSAMSTSTTPRKQKLVDCEVQESLLRKISLHWIAFFLCNAIALMIWIRLYEQPDANWGQTFGDTLRRFLPFFVISAALIPVFVWDTLKLTNRFAGPIMRLRSALSDASAGRGVKPLHFRNNDFWQEIAQNFNNLLERGHVRQGNTESDDSEAPT